MFNDTFRNQKVLVTGHSGFKGAWLCFWLKKMGAKVYGISKDIPTTPSLFDKLGLNTTIVSNWIDIRNLDATIKAVKEIQPDIIFHLAAQPIVNVSINNPIETFETNIMGTANMIQSFRELRSNAPVFVCITSDKCYLNKEWEFGYREIDQLGGKDPYSASKAAAEIVFHSYYNTFLSDECPRAATTRAGNVVGGGDWAVDRLIPDCVRKWASSEIAYIRSPNSTRPWQHVLEPLRGYLVVAKNLVEGNEQVFGESFNFGPEAGSVRTVQDVINKIVFPWTNSKWEVLPKNNNSKESNLLSLSIEKSLNLLNWVPILSFDDTMEMTSRWYNSFYNGASAEMLTSQDIDVYQSRFL